MDSRESIWHDSSHRFAPARLRRHSFNGTPHTVLPSTRFTFAHDLTTARTAVGSMRMHLEGPPPRR